MRKSVYIFHLAVLLAFLSISCGGSPTDTGSKKTATSTITVLVKDTAEVPLNGVQIKTYPETITLITNKAGIAVFEGMKIGEYQVVASRADIPIFYETVSLRYQPQLVSFIIATEVTVNLRVSHVSGMSLEGAEISTAPPTVFVTTDQVGNALMERIPVKKYTFIISRGRANAYIFNKLITVQNGLVQDLNLVIGEQNPHVFIDNPPNRTYKTIFDTRFVADGYDMEDGELPFDAYTWTSDIDGELGTGKELSVDRMSIGHHKITLTGHDSGNLEHLTSIDLIMYFYAKDSYFPIPHEGFWTYDNTPATLSLKNTAGQQELFELHDIEIVMDDVNERTSVMTYRVTGDKTYDYEYRVTDFLDNDIDSFYVTRTKESISFINSKLSAAVPTEVIIETVYDTKLPLLADHLDVSGGNDISFETMAEVFWSFPNTNYGSQIYREEMLIQSETSFEGYETITTPAGTFDTSKIRMKQGETERLWWLAKGYGIVQFSYNTMGPVITSSLIDTNLDELQDEMFDGDDFPAARPVPERLAESAQQAGPPPQELRRLLSVFRAMAPR